MEDVLLNVKNLRTSFFTNSGEVKAVDDISYFVRKGEIVAIVGESGCGKSVSQMSVIQLVQSPPGKILGGEVIFDGKNLLSLSADSDEMRRIRGAGISMIFQEPMTSLNPVFTVGNQITEVIMTHSSLKRKEAWEKGIEAFESVGIPDAAKRMKNYPFEMSGGMRQRVMIAIAVACNSKLIIADEPTTALDVTTQAQVMELLLSIVKKYGTSIILVTHNLGLVTRYADRVYVMYAGRIIENASTEEILTNPLHPYTVGLLNSVPKLESEVGHKLIPIEGAPPNLIDLPDYCAFYPRCTCSKEECLKRGKPCLVEITDNHFVACNLHLKEEKLDD